MKTLTRQALRETIAEMRGWTVRKNEDGELVFITNTETHAHLHSTNWNPLTDHNNAIEALTEWCDKTGCDGSLEYSPIDKRFYVQLDNVPNMEDPFLVEQWHESGATCICLALASAHYGTECRLQED